EWSNGKYVRLARHTLSLSSPRKRRPIFQSRWLWVPSISAFTRVFRRAMRGDDSCTGWSTGFRIMDRWILDARFRGHDVGVKQEQKARQKWRSTGSASS